MIQAILATFFIAMVPVIELRGAIPIGVGMGLSPILSTIISLVGNIVPIPFILILLPRIFNWLRDKKYTKKLIKWLEKKADKNKKTIDKYGYWGLVVLVAIPLPGTGAWTGALVASCLEMNKKRSFLDIVLGVLIAAIIVFLITYGVVSIK